MCTTHIQIYRHTCTHRLINGCMRASSTSKDPSIEISWPSSSKRQNVSDRSSLASSSPWISFFRKFPVFAAHFQAASIIDLVCVIMHEYSHIYAGMEW